jgi:hypothetical protein
MTEPITQQFDRAMLKIWFAGGNYSRNVADVMTVERNGNVLMVYSYDQRTFIFNWDNISLIEEIEQ